MRIARLLFVSLCLLWPLANAAELRMDDRWQTAGRVTVSADRWSMAVAMGAQGIQYRVEDQALTLALSGGDARIAACEVRGPDTTTPDLHVRFDDETVLRVGFAPHGTLTLAQERGKMALRLLPEPAIAIGLLPGDRLESVRYDAGAFEGEAPVHVPAVYWMAGLLHGSNGILACSWPGDAEQVALIPGRQDDLPAFRALDITLAKVPLYVELLAAPGIWHRRMPAAEWLERDVAIDWRPPFEAQWRSELPLRGESEVLRQFFFTQGRRDAWRPETGEFVMPLFFKSGVPHCAFSKKVPPTEELVIYPYADADDSLKGFLNRTPVAEVVKGRFPGNALPAGPRGAPNVGFNACWGTQLIRRTIYTEGLQHQERDFLKEHATFLADYDAMIQQRNAGYFASVEEARSMLSSWLEQASDPDVRAYLGIMLDHADAVEEGHRRKMAIYGDETPEAHIAHANACLARIEELFDTPGQEVYPECEGLVDTFNRLGWGHNESTGMRFSMLVRNWAQEAALGCVRLPGAVQYAQALRMLFMDAVTRSDW